MEKASGGVERGMQQIIKVKIPGRFSGKYSLC